MSDGVYVGVDAGGTRTVCVVGDREHMIGRGEAGAANPTLVGTDGFRRSVVAATEAAFAGVRRSVAGVWIGAAGSEDREQRALLVEIAKATFGTDAVTVSHDGRLLLAAAGVLSGVALVSGTGSSAYGRAKDGREAVAGGWGSTLGDEGSGYDVAVHGLRAVVRAADGRGPETMLTGLLLGALEARSVHELRAYRYPSHQVTFLASLAPIVFDLADRDAVAASIVAAAADELEIAALACRRRLMGEPDPRDATAGRDDLPVVAAGGCLKPGSPLRLALAQRLETSGCGALLDVLEEPAAGALALARDPPEP
jgi:N-acetylglucosamine kinase-like BadF-type ATPase